MQRLADRDGGDLADEQPHRRKISVGPEYPADVPYVLLPGGLPRDPQHVGLRVDTGHGTYPPREGKRQLAGAAGEVHHHVGVSEAKGTGQQVDDRRWIAVPVPVIETGDLAAESVLRHGFRQR